MTAPSRPWRVITHDGAGPAPDHVAAALAKVLDDMQPPTPLRLGVGWAAGDRHEPATLWIRELGDLSLTGVPIFASGHEELLEQLAHQLQEQFFPETAGGWAQARPACPGHRHPAEVGLRAGEAWWRCPASGTWLGRVGALYD